MSLTSAVFVGRPTSECADGSSFSGRLGLNQIVEIDGFTNLTDFTQMNAGPGENNYAYIRYIQYIAESGLSPNQIQVGAVSGQIFNGLGHLYMTFTDSTGAVYSLTIISPDYGVHTLDIFGAGVEIVSFTFQLVI